MSILRTDFIPLVERLRGPCLVVAVDAATRALAERYINAVDALLRSSRMLPALYDQTVALYEQACELVTIDEADEMIRTAIALQKRHSVSATSSAAQIALTAFMTESNNYVKTLREKRVKTISPTSLDALRVLHADCLAHNIVAIPHGTYRGESHV